MRSLVGEEHVRWGETECLLADIYDRLAWADYHAVKMAGGKMPKPKPYPRPWAKGPEPKVTNYGAGPGMTVDELREYLRRPRVEKVGGDDG